LSIVRVPSENTKKTTFIEIDPTYEKNSQKHRVVQTTPGQKTKEAPKDSYLGFQNQSVDRETNSKNKSIVTGGGSSKKSNKNSRSLNLSKLGIPLLPEHQVSENEREWATPGLRPQDYVRGLPESDQTALNTREYVFYGYFQRIREQLDRAWIPILREKLLTYHRTGRHLASDRDHTTRLVVVLNAQGEITRVQVIGESGVRDLDDAAVSAFNRAGPFPNPPKGIIDINHEIKIPWDFILKT